MLEETPWILPLPCSRLMTCRQLIHTVVHPHDPVLAFGRVLRDSCPLTSSGDGKSDDAANFGIFKQNWGMLRECSSQFKGQSQADWNNGAALNSDLNGDVKARHECESYYGRDTWFAGHRNGASGLSNPNTQDINSKSQPAPL